jgi:hypothetical protein
MEYSSEIELVLNSLNKERQEYLDKANDIDKLIKKIKYGNLNLGLSKGNKVEPANTDNLNNAETKQQSAFPLKADLKVQALKVMDLLGVASKLKDIRDKYHEVTGLNVNFRETLRTLNKHDLLKILQPKGNIRGLYWIKTDWLDERGNLKEQHKFNGFELLFTDDMVEYK